MEDEAIRALVERLARPHRDGGLVIERAALAASGSDAAAVEAWILARDGRPEAVVASRRPSGLHGGRVSEATSRSSAARRFLLPRDAIRSVAPPSSVTSQPGVH